MNIVEGERTFDFLKKLNCHPQNWNTVLYIGWHPNTFGSWKGDYYIHRILNERSGKTSNHTIIERSNAYFNVLKNHPITKAHNIKPIKGDIVNWVKDYKGENFDLIIWWHGPEHIEEKFLKQTLDNLEKICNYAIIIGCPEGSDPKNIEDNYVDTVANDWHHHNVTQEELISFGYETEIYTRHNRNQGDALTGIKVLTQ